MPLLQVYGTNVLGEPHNDFRYMARHILKRITKNVLNCPEEAIQVMFIEADCETIHIHISMTEGRSKDMKVDLMKKISMVMCSFGKTEGITIKIDDSYALDEWAVNGLTWEEKIRNPKVSEESGCSDFVEIDVGNLTLEEIEILKSKSIKAFTQGKGE